MIRRATWTFSARCVALAGVAAFVASGGSTSASVAERVIAIEHVTAIPMVREGTVGDATILITGDRISAVGRAGDVHVPVGATRIDGRGLYALPGFVDMHVHPYDTEGFASYLAFGVTTVAVMNGSPRVLDWRERQRRGTLDGPNIYSASPTVNGYPPGNPTFISVRAPGEAAAIARDQKRAGYDFIKAYSFLDRDVYDALTAQAKQSGIAVVGHIPFAVGYAHAMTAGQVNVAHIEEFFQTADVPDDSMPVVARRVKAAGATVTANLFAYRDYLRAIADLPGVLSDPEMRFASPALFGEKLPSNNRAINRTNLTAFAALLTQRYDRFQRLLRAFEAAGVPIFVGTDTEIFGFPGQSAQSEMTLLKDAGLTPYQVLAAATRNAGAFVERTVPRAEQFGTLAPGMRADVVLLHRNPLDDVRNVGAVAGTMVRGRWYAADRLARMRDSVATRTTPERAFVARFDSVLAGAHAGDSAVRLLREFRQSHPDAVPFAEVVWRRYGQLLDQQHAAGAVEFRRVAVDVYPTSFSANYELGRAYLSVADTTNALVYIRRSVALSPHNFVSTDLLATLLRSRK